MLQEISLRYSQGVKEECREVIIPSIPHQFTIIQAAIKKQQARATNNRSEIRTEMDPVVANSRKLSL